MLIVAFLISIIVCIAMLVQVSLGSVPRLYPLLGILFPIAVAAHNWDVLRLIMDSFLPTAAVKGLFVALICTQVASAVTMVTLGVEQLWARGVVFALVLSQIALIVTLFVMKKTGHVREQRLRCAIMLRVRDQLDRLDASLRKKQNNAYGTVINWVEGRE
jgi:hypothetical protein